jgi:predicted esterase
MPAASRADALAAVPAHEHHLTVARTARYYTIGDSGDAIRSVWIVAHGYGQLGGTFVREFAPVDDGTRLVVAPEALSRFYVEDASRSGHAAAAVGGSWMTREDRESEIGDQVAYLDALYDTVFARVPRERVRLTVLGFSQGVATIARWLVRTTRPVDRTVIWAGYIPDDVLAGAWHPKNLTLVGGTRDRFAVAAKIDAQLDALRAAEIPFSTLTFEGGHRLDDTVLRELAARDV